MKSTSRLNWPERDTQAYYDDPASYFRLITHEGIRVRNKGSIHPNLEPRQGELLADAKYHLYDNKSVREEFLDGGLLMVYLKYEYKTIFIPWVMDRCTIIRLS